MHRVERVVVRELEPTERVVFECRSMASSAAASFQLINFVIIFEAVAIINFKFFHHYY